jgi:type I restriction-modification system DNA methylase subunit
MPERSLQLDDLRDIGSPEKIASLFGKLGYTADAQPLDIDNLQLSARSTEAIYDAYMIADQGSGGLQVLLFQLQPDEWTSPSIASSRMRAIASQVGRRETEFLLLATKDYDQLMLVNCRKSFDAQTDELKASIRKLLIDRTNPTAYDCDRLNEIAVRGRSSQELYKVQCEAFDVEKLTKQFYRGYKDLFEKVQKVIKQYNSHPYFDDSDRLHQFSQRLLGRMMFLYFLQKKEFLGGDRKFLTNQYQRLRLDPEDTDYYAEVLEPLFFDTLNKQHPNLESRWGKIPYLNGGLFDRDYGEGIKDAAGRQTPESIELPNSLFDPGSQNSILGFFNGYNFTISENVQGDEDVAVDPEMLGKVFENMLAAEERGQSGTFYTPRGIVQFMCTEVLSRYLADESEMDLETVKKIIDFDSDQPDSEFNKLMTSQQARKLKRALEDIKVLDPAVGSGAFPLGMMQVILAARQAIGRREGETIKRGSLAMSRLKRGIIANNLYGVDIKPEAIEIAKLRMWLSLIVDIPDIEDVEPLPNLDYKLMCGDSLISTIHGEQLIPDPTKTQQGMLAVTPIQQAIQPLLELQHQYFDAQTEERHRLREQILSAEANVFRVAVADRRQYWKGKQQELERKIKVMKGKASKAQEKERVEIAAKLAELDKFALEVESGERALNFFQYNLHFRDVFEEKDGFDVVIGNPPYVRHERIEQDYKDALKIEYSQIYSGRASSYIYFYKQGFELLRLRGLLAYISQNTWFKSGYGSNLRDYIASNCHIHSITDFGVLPIFDAAVLSMIFIASKGWIKNQITYFTQVKSLEPPYPDVDTIIKQYGEELSSNAIDGKNWILTDLAIENLINKMGEASVSLNNYTCGKIYWGVKTGFNQAFYIDGKKRKELIELDKNSEKIIKPLLIGDNVRKWRIEHQDTWLIYSPWNLDIEEYPAIKEHLLQYKNKLESRPEYKQGRYNWWCMARYGANSYSVFEPPKIVYPEIAHSSRFTLDTTGAITNNKVYVIASGDLYLLGLLNSRLVWLYLKSICSALLGDPSKGGGAELRSIYIKKIPIPTAPEPDRLAIEGLVQKCLDTQGQGAEEWEAEIDDRVAHLYGLTTEEMKIIREG